nr:reverse transcriptase domain-containing protein [Tanacetum cinerariifolium]
MYVAKEENMIKYLDKVKSLVSRFSNFSIRQLPQSKNKKADALSKIALTSFAHLSKQVLVEILKEKSIKEKEVTTVVEENGLVKDIKEKDKIKAKAEQAFKQLKQHLSELPLLVAPKPKEELIVYFFATYGAISMVLMTKRRATQTPIYFISRVLQASKLNYTPMEKLVLSLFFAAKRLRSVMLEEHNITYRPRTSVKGQILADFLIEIPNENPPATPVEETQQEP